MSGLSAVIDMNAVYRSHTAAGPGAAATRAAPEASRATSSGFGRPVARSTRRVAGRMSAAGVAVGPQHKVGGGSRAAHLRPVMAGGSSETLGPCTEAPFPQGRPRSGRRHLDPPTCPGSQAVRRRGQEVPTAPASKERFPCASC